MDTPIATRSIEVNLKTSKFSSDTQKAHLNVMFTAAWLRYRINASLTPFDITSEQFNVLRILRGQHPNPLRLKDISSRMLERCSNTTRLVDRLIDKGLAVRELSTRDGRERSVSLTAKGSDLLQKIDQHWEDHNPHVSSLNPEELKHLSHLLDRLREA